MNGKNGFFLNGQNGFSLLELLVVLSLMSMVTIKSYQTTERMLEQRILDKAVATMRVLARRAILHQAADSDNRWPESPASFVSDLVMKDVIRIKNDFGQSISFSTLDSEGGAPEMLQIETQLPTEHQARYVASRLGVGANHEGAQLSWLQVPMRRGPEAPESILDANIDLQGRGIVGLRSINSPKVGSYELHGSIIKVNKLITHTLAAQTPSWLDKPKGVPAYRSIYRGYGGWPNLFQHNKSLPFNHNPYWPNIPIPVYSP